MRVACRSRSPDRPVACNRSARPLGDAGSVRGNPPFPGSAGQPIRFSLRGNVDGSTVVTVLRSRVLLCTVLGTITVDGSPPGSGLERRLLAALLVWRRTVVSSDRLMEVLWPDGAPPSATNTLQSKVSRLRRLVGPGRLIRVGSGYVLDLPEHGCDADRFTDLVAGADGLEPADRIGILDEAIGLWSGRAYDDFADDDFARPAAIGLEQRRLAAEEKRLEARLALGRFDDVISAAEQLIVEDPFREGFWAAEMEALHRSGRSIEALRCYTRARDRFIDETGLPPSSRLTAIEQTILLDEPDRADIGRPGDGRPDRHPLGTDARRRPRARSRSPDRSCGRHRSRRRNRGPARRGRPPPGRGRGQRSAARLPSVEALRPGGPSVAARRSGRATTDHRYRRRPAGRWPTPARRRGRRRRCRQDEADRRGWPAGQGTGLAGALRPGGHRGGGPSAPSAS